MIHRPWPYTQRLVDKLADSGLQDAGISIQREPRSEGLHASELLHVIHPRDDGPTTPEQLNIYAILGLAFEDRVETALLALAEQDDWPFDAIRPGEVEADGVKCSPDILLLSKADGSMRELSIKVTWKSCRGLPTAGEGTGGFPPKFDYYLDQCLTYATPLQTSASVLLVYFVRGDYSGAGAPQILGWELDFTKREREEQWRALQGVRKRRGL